ncbi:hypothetical protein, partial [uncultured Dubosiella sp.]|uniref:hypothetical protein n=1 Tax=uncultured Dubosiella sp. TaxID=1937011 RepID=UPI002592FC4D
LFTIRIIAIASIAGAFAGSPFHSASFLFREPDIFLLTRYSPFPMNLISDVIHYKEEELS